MITVGTERILDPTYCEDYMTNKEYDLIVHLRDNLILDFDVIDPKEEYIPFTNWRKTNEIGHSCTGSGRYTNLMPLLCSSCREICNFSVYRISDESCFAILKSKPQQTSDEMENQSKCGANTKNPV